MPANIFSLANDSAYKRWREKKLALYPISLDAVITEIRNPKALSSAEKSSLLYNSRKLNFSIYHCNQKLEKTDVKALAEQLGLVNLASNICADLDGISSVKINSANPSPRYIPYSNKPLNWHTDGYYHEGNNLILSFILHCANPANHGGENSLLDHEIAYLLLRDKNPNYITALMHESAMTIPSNINEGQEVRKESVGPVFSIGANGNLRMRYTARTRSIHWRDNNTLTDARAYLSEILNESDYIFRHTLQSNQGLICNNILHARNSFTDTKTNQRLIYRVRYYDTIKENT